MQLESAAALVHPHQLEVQEFSSYSLIIDARSPHEYAEDHIPGAVNLPVVDDNEYAVVGTQHKTDKHAAYLIGVEYSLRNIAAQIKPLISRYSPNDRFLVYCFRGGKRSRLWADNLRTIGFEVDVLSGGWKNYRRWVRSGLDALPRAFSFRVLCGPTGCGKTRVLQELQRQGHQVLELEGLASHRGSLLGDLPGQPQPTQKLFDTHLVDLLRTFDPEKPVWIEAESKKIGNLQLPDGLYEAMHRSPVINLAVPMSERVKLWREDYPHFAADPVAMVRKLEPLKPLVGKETLGEWTAHATQGRIDALFESVMRKHYDPCYERSSRGHYGAKLDDQTVELNCLDREALSGAVRHLVDRFSR
ncbi:tRNA 2-selenouridine(34) synthase MnmH [Aquabacterium sp. J223]|uniref:tRNA 2-selenouridine(34) synthase MnmH n=1 Tax=Aquabacterium sp. J223 TaxID=2898431 RepID=UPI0021ADC7F3|nr:tRNA 2-selenouridine(34) synthase MnmH [Aquabacterium sp. J223]UUX96625.1 tRNA 2-selenouridine(34) synthase MnmH [Aquabacterium sp. J223]